MNQVNVKIYLHIGCHFILERYRNRIVNVTNKEATKTYSRSSFFLIVLVFSVITIHLITRF